MKNDAGVTSSLWMSVEDVAAEPALMETVRADVCVVGAGIAGMSAAYLLARSGKSVVLVDDGGVGSGETARTTAHLSNALDDLYQRIEEMRGAHAARLAAESHTRAIDTIEQIVSEEAIECGFERLNGYLFLGPGQSAELLDSERDAARRAGIAGVERLERTPIATFDTGPCLRFPRQGQFHPMRYLAGLARAFARDGGKLFTDTHAEKISGGDEARVETQEGGDVICSAVIVATNAPVNDLVGADGKQEAHRTYAIAALIPPGSAPRALYWDTEDPYHYVRLAKARIGSESRRRVHPLEYDVLIVGGEDHKTGAADDGQKRFERLEGWMNERFPGVVRVFSRWSGQVMEPRDGLALIGKNGDEKNVYIVTGDSGHGMTHGTIAGLLLRDLIEGRENPWAELYDPMREMPAGASGQRSAGRDEAAGSVEKIGAGEGAVIQQGGKKIAVYRDSSGIIAKHSAICAHKGCTVTWNSTEKSWDCGCHGSRYDRFGRVINGPANRGLGPVEH